MAKELIGSDANRPDVVARLEEACKHTNGTLTASELLARVASRDAALFDFGRGVAVFDVLASPCLVRIVAISGSGIDLAEVDAVAHQLAAKVNAIGILASGRPGWKKAAKERGYSMTHVTFFKEFHHA